MNERQRMPISHKSTQKTSKQNHRNSKYSKNDRNHANIFKKGGHVSQVAKLRNPNRKRSTLATLNKNAIAPALRHEQKKTAEHSIDKAFA